MFVALILAMLSLGTVAVSTPVVSATATTAPIALPSTAAGRHAAAYFAAYNAGEVEMKRFLETHVSPDALKRRSLDERLSAYRDLREKSGSLTPLRVVESSERELVVSARSSADENLTMTFTCALNDDSHIEGVRIELRVGPGGRGDDAGPAETSAARMTDAEVVAALHASLDSLSRADAFSGVVLLTHGDKVLLREACGLASRATRVPNRVDTRFNVGSITKAFTKIAIDQLAAAGKLRYDDTIDRYLPEYPRDKGKKITIRQLLDHRAGTGHMFGPAYDAADHSRLLTVADWVKLVRDEPLLFEPGTKQEYSNTGYILLGAIVEKVSGEPYYDYVRKHVYEPAGMHTTDSFARDANVPNRATGYTQHLGGAEWQDNHDLLPGRGSPAGGSYSTVDDLRSFADALRAGRLGAPSEGQETIAGGAPGTNAALAMMGDYTLVVLANLDPPAAERIVSMTRGWVRRAGGDIGDAAGAQVQVGGRTMVAAAGAQGAAGGPAPHVVHAGAADDPRHKPQRTLLPSWTVDVPMLRRDHMPAVEVMVNGRGPYLFAIDTGAAGTARVDSALAEALGLPKIGEVQAGDPSGKNMRTMTLVGLDSVSFGGVRFEGLTAAVRGYNEPMSQREHIDGILGFGLFEDCLFSLDYPANRVQVAKGSLPANDPDAIAFRSPRGIPEITLEVAGRKASAHIDAGAMGGFSLPESLAKQLTFTAEPKVIGHARTVSNTFEVKGADLQGDITIGGLRFANPSVSIQPILPDVNVGSRVLRDFRLTFDQKSHRMRMVRGTAVAEGAK